MEKKFFIMPNSAGIFVSMDKLARIDSRTVAEAFGESHDDVMKAIENLDCSVYFRNVNFELSEYEDDNGKSCPCYTMTREGFTRLVQEYNKEKYAEIRKELFQRFNEVESLVNEKLSEEFTERNFAPSTYKEA